VSQNDAEFHLAVSQFASGRLEEAAIGFRNVLGNQPRRSDALHYLGVISYHTGRFQEAVALLRQSIECNPFDAEAYSNLGASLNALDQWVEAEDCCRRAIRLNPSIPGPYTNLANILSKRGQGEAALRAYQQAVTISPGNARYHTNLGGGLTDLGRFDEAILAHRRAIELDPHMAEAHWNLALVLLLTGDATGWLEYEWRWKSPRFSTPRRDFAQPQWQGEPIGTRTILLHAEQGLGDTIQFARLAPLVADNGGHVILECHSHLTGLLSGLKGVERVIPAGQPLPGFDLHCPLGSLPLALGIGLDSIPGQVPYLKPDTDLLHQWRARLGDSAPPMRVGLVWAGSPAHAQDRFRSITLSDLSPLAKIDGVEFYSFQKGEAASHPPPDGMKMIELGGQLNDFSDTAAAMSVMNLIITVDTAVAHLAGALARPAWLMLPFIPDWRWRLQRADSPWYPSLRLFRQPTPGDWQSVIREVAVHLQLLAANRSIAE
jgi:Flp pilus assembly protein TadD